MASPSPTDALVTMDKISLSYGQFAALKQINIRLNYAEIHAIVGEHGSGKSSLGMILSGVIQPHAGTILFEGTPYSALTVKRARKLGIEMVYQHVLSLNERVSVAENLLLATASLHQLLRKQRMLAAAHAFLANHAVAIDPRQPVEELPLSERLFVDILKHLYARPKLLILDEILEKLSGATLAKTLEILKRFQQAGMAVLVITHRIDDVYDLADRVSILKHGELLLTDSVRNIDKINLIKIAYTQVSAESEGQALNQEFYQLLKYNEAILRHLPVNLIITDPDNRIRMVNDHCRQRFQLQQASYHNLPLDRVFSSQNADAAAFFQQMSSFREEKALYQVPVSCNGVDMLSNIKNFPIYDGAFLIGNILILEDMTEYDRLQKQVILSEKLASVGLLSAGVAHEINNPLEIIYTYMSYVKHKFHAPEFHKVLDTIHEQIASIANIVSNLRSFSDSHPQGVEEFELNGEIRAMLKLVKHNARHRQIAIRFDAAEEAVMVQANKHEIKQVLLNLLKNSFEAMPSGGSILIETRRIREHDAAQIAFTDTGQGISDENPNNIFLPFYSTKKGVKDNLGLGLSVSYGIITKYHGTMTVQNLAEGGCRFLITLPLRIEPQ